MRIIACKSERSMERMVQRNMSKFSAEVRALAKRANQRMVRLEKAGVNSPAYKAAQTQLEMMGRRSNKATGRRFSETGKGTENELRQQKAALERFLNQKTSTVSGYNKMQDEIYKTADKKYGLEKAGVSKEDYFELWDNLPDKEKDRMYYATFYIEVMEVYEMKKQKGEIRQENELTLTDIIRILDGSNNLKSALNEIGIKIGDVIENRERLYGENWRNVMFGEHANSQRNKRKRRK